SKPLQGIDFVNNNEIILKYYVSLEDIYAALALYIEPEFHNYHIMIETKISFKSYDGYSLEGTFIKANNEKGAALFVHGITSSRDELGFHGDYAAYLGINSISSLRFDLRFHGIHETTLKDLSS